MDVEGFVTGCFREQLGAELLSVSATPMAGTVRVLVKVQGRLSEAEAVAANLMAELAELDRTLRIAVELAGAN
jgi:hypothetical protein